MAASESFTQMPERKSSITNKGAGDRSGPFFLCR